MKGKKKDKKKVGKTILLAMSFVMTIVLTFTITLAWFYDSDWASNYVTMAGSVGIELQDKNGKVQGDAGELHFLINGDYAYPGQAIDVVASVFNNGGKSAEGLSGDALTNSGKGSSCYVRAQFAVYTDIGHNEGSGTTESSSFSARILYDYLVDLIAEQNKDETAEYRWIYYENTDPYMELDDKFWFNGVGEDAKPTGTFTDGGYFYLCVETADSKVLKPLEVGKSAAFLWDDRIIIPWQLTNVSADKKIFVGLSFQAIQTFIPIIENGEISKDSNNQLDASSCTYDSEAVQTVFNSCYFTPINLVVDGINFGNGNYGSVNAMQGTTEYEPGSEG